MSRTIHSHLCLGPHGFHRIGYGLWLESTAAGVPVIMIHGLPNNARDFDVLAQRLQMRRRVLTPDMPGRGISDWLPNPEDYGYSLYVADTASLIAAELERSGVDQVDFVGTSMGGMIGMMLASQRGSPIRRLVLNDVGPLVPKAALAEISAYFEGVSTFATLDALEAAYRAAHAAFGELTDRQWRELAVNSARTRPEGGYAFAHDPGIGVSFRGKGHEMPDLDVWALYDRITCQTLVIHGIESTLLRSDVVAEMRQRGPKPQVVTVGKAGHAPALVTEPLIESVVSFLSE